MSNKQTHKSHTIASRLGLLGTCAILIFTMLLAQIPTGSVFMQNLVGDSLVAHAEDTGTDDPTTEDKPQDETDDEKKDEEDEGDGEKEEEEAETTTQVGDPDSFVAVAQKVSEKPREYIELDGGVANSGNAWAALGGTSRFFAVYTKASRTVSYDDLANGYIAGEDGKVDEEASLSDDAKQSQNVYGTAGLYGYVLDASGLDHSFAKGEIGEIVVRFGRLFMGALVMAGYLIQLGVNYAFKFLLDLLDYVNVFKMVTDDTSGMGSALANSPFSGIQMAIADLYNFASSVGLILAVIMFGGAVGLAVMGLQLSQNNKHTREGQGLAKTYGKYLFRILIILFMPIILGVMFASIIDTTKNHYEATNGSDYAIYSNLVDFQKWTTHSRLALPNGSIDGLVATKSSANRQLRPISHQETILINARGAGLRNAQKLVEDTDGSSYGYKTDNNLLGSSGDGKVDIDSAIKDSQDSGSGADSIDAKGVNTYAMNVLKNWWMMTPYRASQYEAYVKNKYAGSNDERRKEVEDLDDKFIKAISNDGSLRVTSYSGSLVGQEFVTDPAQHSYGGSDEDTYTTSAPVGSTTQGERGGLSSLGMYNYLATTFDDKSMIYTDSTSFVGQASTPYHTAVGLTGRGFVAIGNGLLMLAMVSAMAMLGFFFAMYAINAVVVSVPKIASNLTATAFGSPLYAIKLIVAVFIVGIELIGGAIFYSISQYILVGIASMGDTMMSDANKTMTLILNPTGVVDIATSGALSSTLYGSLNVLSAFILIFVTTRLIKIRGQVLGIFGQMIESFINKVFGMFETTNHQSNQFQNGNNGLYTTDEKGNNQLSNLDGSKSALSERSQDGTSGFNKGSQERSSKVGNPNGLLGKMYNAKSNLNDRLKAEEVNKGRPLTSSEKAKAIASHGLSNGTAGAVRGAGALVGSKSIQGMADDMENRREARIEDSLAKRSEQEESRRALVNDAETNPSGNASEVDDIQAFQRAMGINGTTSRVADTSQTPLREGATGTENGFVTLDKKEDQNMEHTHDVSGTTATTVDGLNGADVTRAVATTGEAGSDVISSNMDATNNIQEEINTTSNATNDITTPVSDVAGQVANAEQGSNSSAILALPISNANEGAQKLSVAQGKLAEAQVAQKNATTDEAKVQAQQAIHTVEREIASIQKGIENQAITSAQTGQTDTAKFLAVAPVTSVADGEKRIVQAQQASQQAQQQLVQVTQGQNVQPAMVQQAKDAVQQASQTVVATQHAVAQHKHTNNVNQALHATSTASNVANTTATGGNTTVSQANTTQQATTVQGSTQQVTATSATNVQQGNTTTNSTMNANNSSVTTGGVGSSAVGSSVAPIINSTTMASQAIRSAQDTVRHTEIRMEHATTETERVQLNQQLTNARTELKTVQGQAVQYFNQQQATSVLRQGTALTTNPNLTNGQAQQHLVNVRDAHAHLDRVTSSPIKSATDVSMATKALQTAVKQARSAGIAKSVVSNPTNLKGALDSIRSQQTALLQGTTIGHSESTRNPQPKKDHQSTVDSTRQMAKTISRHNKTSMKELLKSRR